MKSDHPVYHCALCGVALPRGIRVALFTSPESDEAFLGDFCSVAHAFTALESLGDGAELVPETIFLGVRVEREGHDEEALATVMAEIARRAVRAALTPDEEAAEQRASAPPPPPGLLN